jgi:hypothetical protein
VLLGGEAAETPVGAELASRGRLLPRVEDNGHVLRESYETIADLASTRSQRVSQRGLGRTEARCTPAQSEREARRPFAVGVRLRCLLGVLLRFQRLLMFGNDLAPALSSFIRSCFERVSSMENRDCSLPEG